MSKKHKKHAEHVNHERWLISYADFITLLFAFFVVLFASSQVDKGKAKKMSFAMEMAFNRFSIFDQGGGQVSLAGDGGAKSITQPIPGQQGEGMPLYLPPEVVSGLDPTYSELRGDPRLNQNVGAPTSEKDALARAKQDLMNILEKKDPNYLTSYTDTRGLVIVLSERDMFQSGSEQLTDKGKEVLKGVGNILSTLPQPVRVEGHTDDQPIRGRFRSNWELSSMRAAYVVNWFVENFKLNPSRFSASGFADYRPLGPNSTADERQKNRRVEIAIVTDHPERLSERYMVEYPPKPDPEKEKGPTVVPSPWSGRGLPPDYDPEKKIWTSTFIEDKKKK